MPEASVFATPLFGLTLTLAVYLLAHAVYVRLGQAPLANPVLWGIAAVALVLLAAGIPYEDYFAGAAFIHFLLGPAVVAMAWPLWVRRHELRRRWQRLLRAALLGGAAASGSAVGLGWLLGVPADVLLSLAPKSTTTPVAMGIAEAIGGIAPLAAVFAILSGLVGALTGRYLFDLLGVPRTEAGWMARGFALGTAAHGIGAARAIQVNAGAGAYAGLALGCQVVVSAILIPLIARIFAG
ncbi:LrgB family protein [Verticiella sediminum]|uniref:LrgB family protein n=1 Tax=Verticiella sediminum TaxID=1247510 RepID=A0A556AXI4_9BURK|nr:LrgB family protein [Verticiella sediminum]TSH97654.1 LrgB family protein [Verticiella sediminum]